MTRRAEPGRRPALCRDARRVRTYDLRAAPSSARSRRPAPTASPSTAADQLIVGSGDGRSRPVDLTPMASAASTPACRRPARPGGHPITHLFVTVDGSLDPCRLRQPVTSVDAATGQVLGTIDLKGIADLADGGTGGSADRDPGGVQDPTAVAAALADSSAAIPRTTARGSRAPRATRDRGAGRARRSKTRTAVDKAISDGTPDRREIVDAPRVAVATRRRGHLRRPERRQRVSGPARWRAPTGWHRHRHRRPKLYVTAARRGAGYEVIAVGGDTAAAPDRQRPTRCQRWGSRSPTTTRRRWSTSSATSRGTVGPRDPGPCTSSSPTATRFYRRCHAAASMTPPRGDGRRAAVHERRPRRSSGLRRRRARPRPSTSARMPSRGACPGSSPGAITAALSTCWPGSCSGGARRASSPPSSCCSTG